MLIGGLPVGRRIMDMLIGLVIAIFVIAGAYVGYHASQAPSGYDAHGVAPQLEALGAQPAPDLAAPGKPAVPALL